MNSTRCAGRLATLVLLLVLGCGGGTVSSTPEAAPIASAAPTNGPQRIVLHRDHHVGETYAITTRAVSDMVQHLTVDGQVARHEVKNLAIELVANVVVREVDANGALMRSEYTVERCTTGGEAPVEVVPAGSVIIVTADDQPAGGTITLANGAITDEQRERIDLVVSTRNRGVNDDALFGSESPRAVGDSWPIDNALAAGDLSSTGTLTIAPVDLSGETSFTGIEDVDGVACQRLDVRMAAERFALAGLPPGSVTERASIQMHISGAIPVDASLHRMESVEEMTMTIVVQLPPEDGHALQMTVENHRSKTATIRPR